MVKQYYHLLTLIIFALMPWMLSAQTVSADSAAAAVTDSATTHKARASHRSKHRSVAIISSFNQDSPWSNDYIPTVAMAVSQMPNATCDIFYLNSPLITSVEEFEEVQSNMFSYFSNKKPDYVVMIGKIAFCMRARMKQEWGDIPMVMIANSNNMAPLNYYLSGETVSDETQSTKVDKLSNMQKDYNFTAIIAPYFIKEAVELMMETMHHEGRHTKGNSINELVFVAVPTYLERNNSIRISEFLADNYPGVKYRWLAAKQENIEELRMLLAEPQPGVGILMANWAVQTTGPLGYPIISNQETKLMSSSVNPVFVLSSSLIKNGAAGGAFCDKDVVTNRISSVLESMLKEGKRMSDIPIWECTRYQVVINDKKAAQYDLNLKNLSGKVEYIDRHRTFWQKYHWETIIGLVVLALLVFVFWKRSQLQEKQIKTLEMHRKFVASMPVAYAHVTLNLSPDGKHANNVVYSNINEAMQELINKNGCKTGEYVLFPIDFMHAKARQLFERGHKIDFVHYFDKTDSYYEMFVDTVESDNHKKQPNVRELDIFAVDVTNRVRVENDLKALTRRLDMTINVAEITPWEWDIKTDIMRFDAYSLFGRQMHTVDETEDKATSTFLDVYTEFMPLIHPEDKSKLEVVRNKLLAKDQTSFTIRYRLRLARDNKDVYQWVESRGRLTAFDENGNPATCSGAMWSIYDDTVADPMV